MEGMEDIQIALSALMCAVIVYIAFELRRTRVQIRRSDESQRAHREAMIGVAADVLRTALDDGKGRVLVVEPKNANDNARAGEDTGPGGEVIPLRRDQDPDPSSG